MSASVSTITSKGQVTIPKNMRETLHLYSGDKVDFIKNKNNEIIIKPLTKKASEVSGILSKYKKTEAVSVEDMNQGIKNSLKKKFI
jgi:AbrB family looped-hinge helix DNA binding protein